MEIDLESVVERITDQVLSRLESQDAVGTPERWICDPLNDTHFVCRRCSPEELMREAPDRIGTLPFRDASGGSAAQVRLAASLASVIDHTLLKPDATPADIDRLCDEALEYRFKTVCVNAGYVRQAARRVEGSGVKVCAVVGFPLGATLSDVKQYEARRAIEEGAREIDMVIAIGMLKAGHHSYVEDDVRGVVHSTLAGVPVKVILETCLLTEEEKTVACRLARAAGAAFVKTSTGFSSGGATAHDVRLMRRTVGSSMGVKASGGVRDLATAMEMLRAGASRIGASASVAIVTGDE